MTLRIGIAGLGNVGAEVVRLLALHHDLIAARAGRPVRVTAVSARDKSRDRGVDLSPCRWHADPLALANDPEVDLVVELIGGAEGPAADLVISALKAGKPVVTANKALLARRGAEIARLGGRIGYEAAVAGGIPVIKGLREGLAANEIRAVYGILNGTCNFILSEMSATGRAFDDVLKEAQTLGYAEADPAFDIDGTDAAHKLAILSALAFGTLPDFPAVRTRGIRGVTAADIAQAAELGYAVRLLGIARKVADGIEQAVEPCLVPKDSPVAGVSGALNAVYIDGDFSGKMFFTGAGAGGRPTASAVVADIVDAARGGAAPALFGTAAPKPPVAAAASGRGGSFFLTLSVIDRPGVVADISAILRDHDISLESVIQRGRDAGKPVALVLTTHETRETGFLAAVEKIAALPACTQPPHVMRIEDFGA